MWWLGRSLVFRQIEIWLTTRLLSSPTFHRGVRRIHKKLHEYKHGEKFHDLSEMGGGTQIDKPGGSETQRFLKYYMEELRDQFRGITKK